jgi:alpha-glucosidase
MKTKMNEVVVGALRRARAPFCLLVALVAVGAARADVHALASPDGRLAVTFETDAQGMRWSLSRDGKTLIRPSALGYEFAETSPCDKDGRHLAPMKATNVTRRSNDTTWQTTLGRHATMRDHYNEMTVTLVETEARAVRVGLGQTTVVKVPRRLALVFRAYDEGVAFRYVFPKQEAFEGVELLRELTTWRFDDAAQAWTTVYRGEVASQEEPFTKGPLAKVDPKKLVGMPVLVETQGSTLALCEAALSNWAGLYYEGAGDGTATLRAHLSRIPRSEAATPDLAVIAVTPAQSPWRVALVGDDELDLLRKNDVIATLNPPPDPSIDFSFVKAGASSWDWWVESNNSLSTDLTLKLVDFASEMGWPYHTIDGGWYGFGRHPNHGPNVELKPRHDFDLAKIVAHAKAKNVGIWVWIHWMQIDATGLEETFSRLEKWGVVGVKTDFLNRQDQEMVNWCERVCRVAAKHRIMMNFHGSFKSTGAERTWPNMVTREAVLGNEFNIFKTTITPTHCATLPFTRFLVGPADFTPGSFANVYSKDFVPQVKKGHRYGDETDRCPHWAEEQGTRAHAIAQCVQFDSRLMTLCDWPERYRGAPGVEALRKLPASWKDTIPLAGKCGEFYAVAREAFDGRFYYAATTVAPRTLEQKLDFLGDGEWTMTTYADDPAKTPADAKAIAIATRKVRKGDVVSFALCPEGGAVAVFAK